MPSRRPAKSARSRWRKKMTTTYNVYLVREINDRITSDLLSTHTDIDLAIRAAKRAARTRKPGSRYGQDSLAYVGREATAVVSW